ncbi:MAG: hypothetical protein ACRCWQ_01135, partial [Bacilli bacterium]
REKTRNYMEQSGNEQLSATQRSLSKLMLIFMKVSVFFFFAITILMMVAFATGGIALVITIFVLGLISFSYSAIDQNVMYLGLFGSFVLFGCSLIYWDLWRSVLNYVFSLRKRWSNYVRFRVEGGNQHE